MLVHRRITELCTNLSNYWSSIFFVNRGSNCLHEKKKKTKFSFNGQNATKIYVDRIFFYRYFRKKKRRLKRTRKTYIRFSVGFGCQIWFLIDKFNRDVRDNGIFETDLNIMPVFSFLFTYFTSALNLFLICLTNVCFVRKLKIFKTTTLCVFFFL